ncbi:MAG: acyl-CoA dehydrogenase family protein [Gammaproteobacteria bacterium]
MPIVEHPIAGYALADAKGALETIRRLACRAFAAVDARAPDALELSLHAKIQGFEIAVRVLTELMRWHRQPRPRAAPRGTSAGHIRVAVARWRQYGGASAAAARVAAVPSGVVAARSPISASRRQPVAQGATHVESMAAANAPAFTECARRRGECAAQARNDLVLHGEALLTGRVTSAEAHNVRRRLMDGRLWHHAGEYRSGDTHLAALRGDRIMRWR